MPKHMLLDVLITLCCVSALAVATDNWIPVVVLWGIVSIVGLIFIIGLFFKQFEKEDSSYESKRKPSS